MLERLSLVIRLAVAFYTALACAAQEPLVVPGYKVGQTIPVSCLNRTVYVVVDETAQPYGTDA